MWTNEQDSGRRAQLSQLNSLSMVSISSSSDPSYRMMGMGRGEPWQPPKVLHRDKMHVSNVIIEVWQHEYGFMRVEGKRVERFSHCASIFSCVLSKMTTVLRLFITIYIRLMSQRFDAFKINLFCLFDSAEKNLINNASDVSTYGCLCGGATSFSKTSVVKKPREED